MTAYALAEPTAPARHADRETGLRHPTATMLALFVLSGVFVGTAVAISPAAGCAGLVAVAAGLALVRRPRLSVYLMVLIAPACAGLERGLVVPGLRVSEVAIAGLGLLVLVFAPRGKAPAWTVVEILVLAYASFTALLGGLDLALRHAPIDSTEIGTLLGPFQFVLLLRATVVTLTLERYRVRAANLMLIAATVVGLIALAQAGNLGPTRSVLSTLTGSSLYSSSLGEGVGRVTGPFNIWHELAGFLMPSVLLSFALLLGASVKAARLRYAVALAVTGAALLSTAAVGALLATGISCLYVAWRRGVLRVALAVALPIVLIAAIGFGGTLGGRAQQQYSHSAESYRLPLVPQTLSYRYAIFEEQSAPALTGHWATGFGPDLPPKLELGNFPYAETTYVTLLLRGGAPLLAVFLVLLFVVAGVSRKAMRAARTEFQWSVAVVVFAMTVSYVFLQLIESYLLDSGPPHAFWAFVGLMLAGMSVRPETEPVESRPE